ncbi:transposase [Peribacillus frigoritolerans]|nr:transposase [Peribacillus frigoritolerans]
MNEQKQFAYSFHAAADRNGFVLGTIVTLGNKHDSQILEPRVEQVIEKVGKPEAVAADAAYKTPAITSTYLTKKSYRLYLIHVLAQKKDSSVNRTMYTMNILIVTFALSGEVLTYSTTNKEGYREYKSPKHICASCSFLSRCTESKDCQKVVTRHIWQTHVEEADHLRHHQGVKPIYTKRKETIERVFADAKEKAWYALD